MPRGGVPGVHHVGKTQVLVASVCAGGTNVPFLGTADLMWLRLESCLAV